MTMLRKIHCPKCGGNMFLYKDFENWYEQCLQCSFTKYLDVMYGKKTAVGKEPENEKAAVTLSAN